MRSLPRILALVLAAVAVAACTRGPDGQRLQQDLQARVDGLFGRQVLALESFRRQGSAPYRAAGDGARQVIVYYNGVFRFTEVYDPSDWEGLSPTMIASALGAADEGVTGLRAGPNDPGGRLQVFGSIVYRMSGKDWQVADVIAPRPAAPAAAQASVPKSRADELVRRLAEIVQRAPARRGRDDEIIAEELGRALDNIRLRTGEGGAVMPVAAGPEGGEYWRFLTSVASRIGGPAGMTVAPTAGSVENAFLVDRGEVRLGLVQSDVAAVAVSGEGMFSGAGPLGHLRAVASLFPEPVHVVVRGDSGIETLPDLAGHRVALGAVASGTRQTAVRLLDAAGVGVQQLQEVDAPSPQAALDLLVKGEIDAVVEVVSTPWRQLEIAMQAVPLELLPLDLQTRVRLATEVPGLFPLSIPARTYNGQEGAVPTVAATALLVTRDDVPEEALTSALDSFYAAAASGGAGLQATRLSKSRALDGITIPMHPAAAKFFSRAEAQRPADADTAVPQ